MIDSPESTSRAPEAAKPLATTAAGAPGHADSAAGRATPSPKATPLSSRSRSGSIMLTLLLLILMAGLAALAWYTLEQRNALAGLQLTLAEARFVSPAQLAAVEQAQQQTLARVAEAESVLQQLQPLSQQSQADVLQLRNAVQQAETAMQQLQISLQQMQTSVQQSLQQSEIDVQQTLQQEQQAIGQTLAESRRGLTAQAERLDGITRELVATNLRISDSGAGGSRAWMLNEAESLLRLARQRLLTAHDVRSAIGLFMAVDDLLEQLDDPSVFAARQTLAQELATLQALPEVDVPDLYVQLGIQVERVDSIGVAATLNSQDFIVRASDEGGAGDSAADWLAEAKEALGRYFVITQRDEAVTPLMTGEQQYLVRRGIQLQIEQARLALLRGEPVIYRQALDEAIDAISLQLVDDGGNRDALTAALAALRDQTIVVSIPALDTTLAAVRQIAPAAADRTAEEGL